MTSSTYTVMGMTCQHCVQAVTEELSNVSGVENVKVDLDSGQVTVDSSTPVSDAEIAAAVEEAGYELAANS